MNFQKTYLSRSMTRAMSLDHPIGDPFGGVAYGERNDPVSAIISIATMGGTYAAAGSFAAMTLMQGLTFAGAAMSLVGNVSGNKTLSKIGMIAGVVGGIGSIAEGVLGMKTPTLGDTFGSKAASVNTSAANLTQTPKTVADSGANGASAMSSPASSTTPVPNATVNGSSVTMGPMNPNAPSAYDGLVSSQVSGAASGAGAAGMPSALTTAAGAADDVLGGAANLSGANMPIPTDVALKGGPPLPGIDVPYEGSFYDKAKDFGKGVLDFTKTNPGAAQIAGGLVSGAMDMASGKTAAQIEQLEADTAYRNAMAARQNREIELERERRARLNAGYSQVNTGVTINPNAVATGSYNNPGLISGARA